MRKNVNVYLTVYHQEWYDFYLIGKRTSQRRRGTEKRRLDNLIVWLNIYCNAVIPPYDGRMC